MNYLDQTIDAITAQHPDWTADFYRSSTGLWCSRIGRHCLDAETLSELLAKLLEFRPIPRIPRRPTVRRAEEWHIWKNESRWWAKHQPTTDMIGNIKTRGEAVNSTHRIEANDLNEAAKWDKSFGEIVAFGVEGVDYEYED